jgi:hypothetical protein
LNETASRILPLPLPGISPQMESDFDGLHDSRCSDCVAAPDESATEIDWQFSFGHDAAIINQVAASSFLTEEAVFVGHYFRAGESVMELRKI